MGFLPSREITAEPYSPSSLRVLCQGEGTGQTLGPSVGPSWTVAHSFASKPAGGEHLQQKVPSSPNDSRFVGMLLLEGLKMTEALLLERRWITRSDSNKALKQPCSPFLSGERRWEHSLPAPGRGMCKSQKYLMA